jgi:6-methylsalicylate decarboxylase
MRAFNEYAASVARDLRARFGFFATLAPPDVDGSLKEIEYALDVLKADGIGLHSNYDGKYLGEDTFAPVSTGDRGVWLLRHGVLLVFATPC